MRVRCFTQDDAHLYMTPDQISDEILGVINLVDSIYKVFGFDYRVELSTRPEDFMGEIQQWDIATEALRESLETYGAAYVINEGDGAFYGPKIDFHLVDSLGRSWQCATLQLDFQMPERFELEYIGSDGEKHRPVMIHRTVFGSMERFIGILIEHYAGAFPLWLSPVQIKVMPITDRCHEYAEGLAKKLDEAGLRVETDYRNEKIGFKIREAQVQKINYMIIVGDKEAESGAISVRSRSEGDLGSMELDAFIAQLKQEIADRA
jgi:threonyl-tRNA synthetase